MKATVAIDGHLAWPFDIDADIWGGMTDAQRLSYLTMSASTLLGRYGDAREIKIREDGAIVPLFGEDEAQIQ